MTRLAVVYTMGKVGSTAYSQAIRRAGLDCHDIHSLDARWLKTLARRHLDRDEFPPNHVCMSMGWHKLLHNTRRCHFITGVREPVARNLSAYFQNLDFFSDAKTLRDPSKAKELFAAFFKAYTHDTPLTWFDREIKGHLGIDVYDLPFDRSRKVYSDAVLTILRADADDIVKSAAISKALGVKVTVARTNVSTEKDYGELYDAVRKVATYTTDFIDDMYASKYAQHFFTEEELKGYRAYWLDGVNA